MTVGASRRFRRGYTEIMSTKARSIANPAKGNDVRPKRIAIIGSPEKPAARELLERVRRWVERHGEVAFAEITFDSSRALVTNPDAFIVLGGDGTLISAVHGLGQRQAPILGVNLGKLGYLADFTVDQLEREGEFLFHAELPLTRRALMAIRVESQSGDLHTTMAVNECFVSAGAPFHMIELVVEEDGDEVTFVRGDGVIVATASGSTAHNLSAGGPILDPTSGVFVLTPVCPHTLAFRPVVLPAERTVTIRAQRTNIGTTAVIDGRICHPFLAGDRISITRYPADFLLIRNPIHSPWHALRRKLMWGEGPKLRGKH